MPMIFILSIGLCLFLLIGMILMMNPDLVSPSLAKRWDRNHKYKSH
ncbi:hypothetical protein BH11CYA1_BH11CYA1_31590 [soil metagenome]